MSDVSALQGQTSSSSEYKPNWKVIVPVVLISAVVLLVCLPVGALLIVNSTGCCLANSQENVITFWAAMIAGFLALFAMIITGVFIITAFRVEATARAEAQIAAGKEVWKYIENYRDKLYEELHELAELAPRVKKAAEKAQEDVEAHQREAITAIAQAQNQAASAADEAQRVIGGAQEEAINAARQAQEAIGRARAETTNVAEEAQRKIGEARRQTVDAANDAQEVIVGVREEVERQRTEAISAIDNAREEVEAAARAARDRIDRAGDAPEDEGGSD